VNFRSFAFSVSLPKEFTYRCDDFLRWDVVVACSKFHGLKSELQVLACVLDVVCLHVISCFLLLGGLVNGELSSFVI
jgi:hypothetical protein